MIYWDLFLGFLRVGMFAFGGAYGAIPMIRDIVLSHGWLTDEKLSYMIAVSESTPGPIMLNLATYVGQTQGGIMGAILATFAVVLPSFLIILLLTVSLKTFIKNPWFQAILKGLKPCIIGIVFSTGLVIVVSNCIDINRTLKLDSHNILITVILILVGLSSRVLLKKKMSPILLILLSGFLGVLV